MKFSILPVKVANITPRLNEGANRYFKTAAVRLSIGSQSRVGATVVFESCQLVGVGKGNGSVVAVRVQLESLKVDTLLRQLQANVQAREDAARWRTRKTWSPPVRHVTRLKTNAEPE